MTTAQRRWYSSPTGVRYIAGASQILVDTNEEMEFILALMAASWVEAANA